MRHICNFLAVIFLSSTAFGSAASSLDQLRDLTLLLRVPEKVCAAAAKFPTELAAQGHLAYDSELDVLRQAVAKEPGFLTKAAGRCFADCTCSIFDDLASEFPKDAAKALKTAQGQAAKMADADYQRCQARRKLSCSSAIVERTMREVRAAATSK